MQAPHVVCTLSSSPWPLSSNTAGASDLEQNHRQPACRAQHPQIPSEICGPEQIHELAPTTAALGTSPQYYTSPLPFALAKNHNHFGQPVVRANATVPARLEGNGWCQECLPLQVPPSLFHLMCSGTCSLPEGKPNHLCMASSMNHLLLPVQTSALHTPVIPRGHSLKSHDLHPSCKGPNP